MTTDPTHARITIDFYLTGDEASNSELIETVKFDAERAIDDPDAVIASWMISSEIVPSDDRA